VGEYSGAFAAACRARFPSEIAISVDFRPAAHNHGLHYCGDVRDVLWSRRWRLVIAHPPCAAAARSNTIGIEDRVADGSLWFAMAFALMLYCAPADTVVVEQPPTWLEAAYREPDVLMQFLDYGVPYSKKWLLWRRGGPFRHPQPTTPGATPSGPAAHRIRHHDRDERERLRSATPPEMAVAVCATISLDAHTPAPQPRFHEEVLTLARGYEAAFDTAPPHEWRSPLAKASGARPQGTGAQPAATNGRPAALPSPPARISAPGGDTSAASAGASSAGADRPSAGDASRAADADETPTHSADAHPDAQGAGPPRSLRAGSPDASHPPTTPVLSTVAGTARPQPAGTFRRRSPPP